MGQLGLIRMIWDHEIAGSNPAIWTKKVSGSNPALSTIRTCTYFFAYGAAACWFESSLPDHYREVGKLVKPAIISQVIYIFSLVMRVPYLVWHFFFC